jgi:hypothetical protein
VSFTVFLLSYQHTRDIICRYIAKAEQMNKDAAAEVTAPQPKLDLGFKEGQTITINIGVRVCLTICICVIICLE